MWALKGKKYKFTKEELSEDCVESYVLHLRTLNQFGGHFIASEPANLLSLAFMTVKKSETLECLYSFDKAVQQIKGIENP